jgi:hypothetical protein
MVAVVRCDTHYCFFTQNGMMKLSNRKFNRLGNNFPVAGF